VSRKDRNVVGQNVEVFTDGVEELLVASAGEVGAANAAGKKGVAGKEMKLALQIEGNGIRGMAGNVGDMKSEVS
jgi:hypothetical protein